MHYYVRHAADGHIMSAIKTLGEWCYPNSVEISREEWEAMYGHDPKDDIELERISISESITVAINTI